MIQSKQEFQTEQADWSMGGAIKVDKSRGRVSIAEWSDMRGITIEERIGSEWREMEKNEADKSGERISERKVGKRAT